MMIVWTNELDEKLIEQFKINSKSKVKDFKVHLNLVKLTKKEIRTRLEFLKLKNNGELADQDWNNFSVAFDVKQTLSQLEKDDETCKDEDEPERLKEESKVDMIKKELVDPKVVAKPKFVDESIKGKGFVKEMASQEVKDFKSNKFEDKSLPRNGNVRNLMKSLTKQVVTPGKKKSVKSIVSKIEAVADDSVKEKAMTPSMQAAMSGHLTKRGKSMLLKANNLEELKEKVEVKKDIVRDTPSIKAAAAAKRTTKSRFNLSKAPEMVLEQPMSPSLMAAKEAKKSFVLPVKTEQTLTWTPSRKAAQKAEKVTKSMLDFEQILNNRPNVLSKYSKESKYAEEHNENIAPIVNAKVDVQTPKQLKVDVESPMVKTGTSDEELSARRSPRHKRVMEIPLANTPMQSSPLRNAILFSSPENSPNVNPFTSKMRESEVTEFDLERNTPRKRKREEDDEINAPLMEKKLKIVEHVAPIDELRGRNSFLSNGLYKFANNIAFGAGYQ